jgi:hypothetical protein
MSSDIFVFTAPGGLARDNYVKTIEEPVPVAEVAARAPRAGRTLLDLGFENIRCWGSRPGTGNSKTVARMKAGDWALPYVDGDFPHLLKVASKTKSKRLAESLWGTEEGETWSLMYFFSDVQPVDLSLEEVRDALGHKKNWRPRGLHYPSPENQSALLEKFGSIEAFAASVGTSAPAAEMAALPTARELLLGKRFEGVPANPPRPRRYKEPSDPDASGRGYMAHEETVAKLRRHVGPSFRKGKKGINHDGAWEVGEKFSISEVKSITGKNQVAQLEKGLGQILWNQFKAEMNEVKDVTAYLIAEREPANSEDWRELARRHGVILTWPARFGEDVQPARP